MGDQTIDAARLLPNGYIGRMCVLKPFRNHGVGRKMLTNLIQQTFLINQPVRQSTKSL